MVMVARRLRGVGVEGMRRGGKAEDGALELNVDLILRERNSFFPGFIFASEGCQADESACRHTNGYSGLPFKSLRFCTSTMLF